MKEKTNPGAALTDQAFTALDEALQPYELSRDRRRAMREAIMGNIQAGPPPGTFTVFRDDGEWVSVVPRVERKILRQDRASGNQTALYRLQPGAVIPAHVHDQEEECLVLEGEICFGDYCIGAGDYHVAMAGQPHPAFTSRTGALLLIRQAIDGPHP